MTTKKLKLLEFPDPLPARNICKTLGILGGQIDNGMWGDVDDILIIMNLHDNPIQTMHFGLHCSDRTYAIGLLTRSLGTLQHTVADYQAPVIEPPKPDKEKE